MDTNGLKKFAQAARNLLIDQVTAKLDRVLAEDSVERRGAPQAIKDLEAAIRKDDKRQVIEQVAYTWFNRFTALRFMDANGYTQVRIVSPADGATRPEILAEAANGTLPDGAPEHIAALLDGRTPSSDPQAEAYRLLLVHACNQWHGPMPFLFEQIDDFTELLMPEDLLSQTSILAELRKVMTEDACQDVEIIGWLYQFYISEKKDQVFAGLKKNVKITAENIPAATQLFTPHWIVRYLVENSLGRLWLLNRPASTLASKMDYYIAPVEAETDFLRITLVEDIRICDPACGSGHMLTYAFDLLYAIYEEEGYEADTIPALILTHNLTGVEIDDRAGALAAFALVMKAAARLGRRRFLRMGVTPDICVLQNVSFTEAEMQDVAAVVGKDLFTDELRETLGQFEQAKNFGSLIVPKLHDPAEALRVVETRDFAGDLLLKDVQARVVAVLLMAEALSCKYHVVVANPPYMGGRGMNSELSKLGKTHFPDAKTDAFSMFVQRAQTLTKQRGIISIICPYVWMYISSYENFRKSLLKDGSITSMVQLEYNAFEPATVPVSAWVFSRGSDVAGSYIDLSNFKGHRNQAPKTLEAVRSLDVNYRYSASSIDFTRMPGSPISYQASAGIKDAFQNLKRLDDFVEFTGSQNITGDNAKYLRLSWEVDRNQVAIGKKWSQYLKGGGFRKWSGFSNFIVDWSESAREFYKTNPTSNILAKQFRHREGVTYSELTSSANSFRLQKEGAIYDKKGPTFHGEEDILQGLLCVTNSKVAQIIFKLLNPTLSLQVRDVKNLPIDVAALRKARPSCDVLVSLAESDWDSGETSMNFTTLPLLHSNHRAETLEHTYTTLRSHWQGMTDEMLTLEEENNRIFIDAYGLADELTPEVPLSEITLTCNSAYRYGGKTSTEDRETRLRADTVAEYLSYAVGCMFGRYSLNAPGLILANQGERLEDYLTRIPNPSFTPDKDNVIPMLDGDWFADDITERFRLFLRVTFGDDTLRENLAFLEEALGKDIRKYFTKDFYNDHVKRYKKRPIYWMVSSPRGSFNALIYMHRYRSDTVSVILNDYLREFISKLEGERVRLDKLSDDPSASQAQRTKALKDAALVVKQIDELTDWERDVVFPLAQQKIEIDLDDGVKANYPKFGSALKKIVGVSE
jgi:type II restriction/modification system DNA methylase subunit YeeA